MKVLDLFCGAGGAAMGLHRAWPDAEITGVDIAPQPRYPFRFVPADAMVYPLEGFDFIWASPPCQAYTAGRRTQRTLGDQPHPDLVAPTRERLNTWGRPYVIENVPGAPLVYPIVLCGEMFDLRVIRHRLFESNRPITAPPHQKHKAGGLLDGSYIAVYGRKWVVGGSGGIKGRIPREFLTVEARRDAMNIDWMSGAEIAQAVPPAYSEYIARQIRP